MREKSRARSKEPSSEGNRDMASAALGGGLPSIAAPDKGFHLVHAGQQLGSQLREGSGEVCGLQAGRLKLLQALLQILMAAGLANRLA